MTVLLNINYCSRFSLDLKYKQTAEEADEKAREDATAIRLKTECYLKSNSFAIPTLPLIMQ